MSKTRPRPAGWTHAAVLAVLLVAFGCRVFAQFIQAIFPLEFLPPFEAWAAGGLPYPLLLAAQIVIIMAGAWLVFLMARGRLRARRRRAIILLSVGTVYFVVMALRLVAGLTFMIDNPWFTAALPASFHLVLAAFVLTLGHFHRAGTEAPAAR